MISCAFTIILNGLHHLLHNNYAEKLAASVDYWVIAEGASDSQGSTKWCNRALPNYHNKGRSIDGTYEYLKEFTQKHSNTSLVVCPSLYPSKDHQVSMAIRKITEIIVDQPVFLWQIDSDEQWKSEDMREAESQLEASGANVGKFFWNYFVGPGLLARGEWGERAWGRGVQRLWIWNKNRVITHEPPVFEGLDKSLLLPQRCNHFAYFFEKDVIFKSKWYRGYEKIFDNWVSLQKKGGIRFPMTDLLSGVKIGITQRILEASWIERIDCDALPINRG